MAASPLPRIFIGIGANLPGPGGEPPAVTCRAAVAALTAAGLAVAAVSSLWTSPPDPPPEDGSAVPWYVNGVVRLAGGPEPSDLLARLQAIEAAFGRDRSGALRNAARPLDLDLLDWDGRCLAAPGLELPHPRLHRRAFVLLPLRELAADWHHPGGLGSVDGLIAALPASPIRRLVEG